MPEGEVSAERGAGASLVEARGVPPVLEVLPGGALAFSASERRNSTKALEKDCGGVSEGEGEGEVRQSGCCGF